MGVDCRGTLSIRPASTSVPARRWSRPLHSTSIALALLKNRISLAGKLAGAAVQYLENVYDCPLVTQSDHINAPNSALETEHQVVE